MPTWPRRGSVAAQTVRRIRPDAVQDRCSPIPLADFHRHFGASDPLPGGEAVKPVCQPVIAPVVIDDNRREDSCFVLHRLGVFGDGFLIDRGAGLRAAVGFDFGNFQHDFALSLGRGLTIETDFG